MFLLIYFSCLLCIINSFLILFINRYYYLFSFVFFLFGQRFSLAIIYKSSWMCWKFNLFFTLKTFLSSLWHFLCVYMYVSVFKCVFLFVFCIIVFPFLCVCLTKFCLTFALLTQPLFFFLQNSSNIFTIPFL